MAKTAKSQAKKAGTKKAATRQTGVEKAPAKKAAATSRAKKTVAKKAPAKKAAAKNARKRPAKKAATKKATPAKGRGAKSAAKAKAAPRKRAKPPFDKKFLDEMRESLLAERLRYIQSAEILKAEADALVEGREPGDVQFDEESGEGDTLAVERERDLALSAHARAAVDEIDAALDRLTAGTYGICVISDKPIPKERLRAIPWAAERVEYKAGGFGLR